MSEENIHIRHAPSSNKTGRLKVYCGAKLSGLEWHFTDSDHAILSIEQNSLIEPCKDCIKEIKRILK